VDVHRRRHVLPGGTEEIVAKAGGRREADGVKYAVDMAKRFTDLLANRIDMLCDRHIELEDRRNGVEFAGGALGERDRSASTGQDDLSAFGDRQFGHTERQRGIGENTGDNELFSVEDSHGTDRSPRDV